MVPPPSQRILLPPPIPKHNTGQIFQQKVQNQNRLLPPENINGFFFPHKHNNHLYSSQVQSSEQDLINGMAKMNLNTEYFEQPKPSGPQIFPVGQMPGLTHRRLQQRPTTPQIQLTHAFKNPQNNGIVITQPLH